MLFQQQPGVITIDEITQALDIPKSTAYRYTKTLTDKGFLDKAEPMGSYQLGSVFVEMSLSLLTNSRDLHLAVMPHMVTLAEETGESVSVMRVMNRRAVCIESIEGAQALRVAIERGRSQRLHAGASSKVLLANLPQSDWPLYLDFPLVRYTDATITDWDALQAELRQVREAGFAVSNGEIDIGARAVAVPLRDQLGTVVAALSIESPASRMTDQHIERYVALLQREADTVRTVLT